MEIPDEVCPLQSGSTARTSTHRFLAVGLFLLLSFLTTSLAGARIRPTGFAIPNRMLSLGNAVTPGEYAQLIMAVKAWETKHAQALKQLF